jgi:hypothetical protein
MVKQGCTSSVRSIFTPRYCLACPGSHKLLYKPVVAPSIIKRRKMSVRWTKDKRKIIEAYTALVRRRYGGATCFFNFLYPYYWSCATASY